MSVLDQDISYLRILAARGDKSAKVVVNAYDIARQDVYAPSFSSTIQRIYVRATGDNDIGDGKSEETAYRTFVHAVRDVPLALAPGKQYFLDITNLGDEVLPADFALPAWVGSRSLFDSNVFIIADHEPARILSEAEYTVTVTAASANPTTKTLQATDDSQDWEPGALKGYFLSFGDPADPLISVIYDNTSDTLFLSGNDGDPVVAGVGWVGMITEPSARFQTSTAETFAGFRVNSNCDIYIAGIRTEDLNDPEGTSLLANNSGLVIERSQIIRGWLSNAPRQYYFVSNYGVGMSFDSRLYLSRSYLTEASFNTPAQTFLAIHSGTVLENTSVKIGIPLTDQLGGGGLTMKGVLIKDAPDDAVKMIGGSGTISGVQIDDTQNGGNAISLIGPGRYILSSVIGTGNEGVGVFCTDGAHVEGISVVGTGDGDLEFIPPDEEDEESVGYVILSKTGAGFRENTEAVQTVVISGSSNPANDGTFPVYGVIDGDNLVFGNPNGVTESGVDFVVDPVTVTGADDMQVGDLAADDWPDVPYNVVDVFAGDNPNKTGTGARLFNK